MAGVFSVFLVALVVLAPGAVAYYRYSNASAIQEAFELGRKNNEDTTAFLTRYSRQYSTPQKGLYVSSIEFLTPYAQLVNDAMLDMANENVYDVQRKYASRPDMVLVRVRVYSTPTRMLPSADEDIWREITIRVSDAKELKSKKKSLNLVYPGDDAIGFDYADMELQFDAKDIDSAPITIEVFSLDGQRVEAKFDLAKLK